MFSSEGNTLLVGARDSRLSKRQVDEVLNALQTFHPHIKFSPLWLKTRGDLDLSTSLRELDKSDFFTQEIDRLQMSGGCRLSVHSAKDLPQPLPKGLKIVALTAGVDPRDSLVMRERETLESLPSGARIATSSFRREERILALRSDICCVDIRGAIDHRLARLTSGEIDALVVAEAALIRLELTHLNRLKLEGDTAPLQGKLAVLALEHDREMAQLFACIDTQYG